MTAQFGPHRWSAGDYDSAHTDEFGETDFTVRDLRGARFVDCDMSGVRIIDAALMDVSISGYVDKLVVNGVDVTRYVDAELDRRHPERVQLRAMRSPDTFREMWDTVERIWADGVARAEKLPEPLRQERVDGEWSFVETMRHLIFIVDCWVSRTVLDQEMPFHRLGLPQTAYRPADAAALGIDVAARPTFDEVMAVRVERMAVVRGLVDGLTGDEMGRICLRSPAPGYPDEPRAVADCLAVLMDEECEHYRFAMRDLSVLEGR